MNDEKKIEKVARALDGDFSPDIGDKVYVPCSNELRMPLHMKPYIFTGGLATICEVEKSGNLVLVRFKEHPTTAFNWAILREQQKELKEEHGDQLSHLVLVEDKHER